MNFRARDAMSLDQCVEVWTRCPDIKEQCSVFGYEYDKDGVYRYKEYWKSRLILKSDRTFYDVWSEMTLSRIEKSKYLAVKHMTNRAIAEHFGLQFFSREVANHIKAMGWDTIELAVERVKKPRLAVKKFQLPIEEMIKLWTDHPTIEKQLEFFGLTVDLHGMKTYKENLKLMSDSSGLSYYSTWKSMLFQNLTLEQYQSCLQTPGKDVPVDLGFGLCRRLFEEHVKKMGWPVISKYEKRCARELMAKQHADETEKMVDSFFCP